MSRLVISLIIVIVGQVALVAQTGETPVFGPPPTERKPVEEKAVQEPLPTGDRGLIDRLSRWPDAPAQQAGRALVLEGGRVVPLLVESLANNDWRIRCGSAWALGELREQSAFPELRQAARDIANRISVGPFFGAMVKIDSVKGTAEILEFLASTDARVAKEAFDSLPETIDTTFESRLAELARHDDATVRQRALSLSRRLNRPAAIDLYLTALGDPSQRVACEARDILVDRDDAELRARLRSVVIEGALRPAAYAILALVMIEDRTNQVLLDESPEMKRRLLVFLNIRGEFENAVGAIAFANISVRTGDPEIRAFADTAMLDILLGTAASGVIFRDYAAVKTLAFRKASLVSGESFGEDIERWSAWWTKSREGFHARRELKNLDPADIDRMVFRYSRRVDERGLNVVIRSGEPVDDRFQVIRPIYVDHEELKALAAELERLGFFARRGMQRDVDWAGDYVDASVIVDSAEFRRAHYGDAPADLVELESWLNALVAKQRWQSFWNPRANADFRSWFLTQRDRLGALAGDARALAVAKLGLEAYPTGSPQTRRDALAAWRAAGPDYISEHGQDFVAMLKARDVRPERAIELLDILAERPGLETTRSVLAAIPFFSPEGRTVALAFLARRPTEEIVELDESELPEIGPLVMNALAERCDEPMAVERILATLSDPDPRVQQAIPRAFPEGAPQALRDALGQAIDKAEGSRRLRLIEIWGAIAADHDLAALNSWFDAGSLGQKQAVVRAWAKNGGESALDRLFDVAVHCEEREVRSEAQSWIATSDAASARQRMRRALDETTEESRFLELFRTAAEIFRADAENELGRFLTAENQLVRQQAAELLAPQLVTAAIPQLLTMLLDKSLAGRAWEDLELLTCVEMPAISNEEVYVAYEKFWREHKEEAQDSWFMAALERQGMPSANLLGYLNGNKRDLRSIALLLKTLESDKWFLRANAHIHLGRIRGETLGAITRSSTPAEVERVRNRWAEWYKALLGDL